MIDKSRVRVQNSSLSLSLSLSLTLLFSLSFQRLKFILVRRVESKDLARDPVVGRGGVAAELPQLPLKRELRGRVRRRRSRCLMFG